MNFSHITEAYQSIYEPMELNEEFLSEEYDGIEDLTEEDFDDIAEETVYEVLEEGLEVDELDDIFEAVIMELNPYAPAGSKESKAYQKSTSASKRGAERAAAVSAAKERVGSSVKGAIKKVKTSALAARDSAQKTAKGLKQQSHVGIAKYANKHNLVKGAGLKTQSSKGRGELRSAVAKHVGSRIKDKIKSAVGKVKQKVASAAVSGYAAARSAKQAVGDAAGRAKQSAKNLAARTGRAVNAAKSGAKSAVGKAARKVATGAGNVASKLGEEFDTYDIVLEFLCVEGYAETLEDAEWIMVNELDDDDIEEIIEARRADQLGHARGTAANPDNDNTPYSDASQKTRLHSRLRQRSDQMGRERRGSAAYRAGRRPPLSKKEKAFLQAGDRTSPGRGHVRHPNVPDTGSHAQWSSERRAQRDPKQNPKHNANKG